MAFDAGMLCAVAHEIRVLCMGAKVEKIHQPVRDEVDLILRGHRLVIQVGSSVPHISITKEPSDNPPVPPMLCMLLRKHLVGALLSGVVQCGFDRILRLEFDGHDDMGFPTKRTLVVELMGKYNNLVLLDQDDKIISAVKFVDFSASEIRQILPGIRYTLPPAQEKCDPLTGTREDFDRLLANASPAKSAARFLADSYSGIAIDVAREIAFRATGSVDTAVFAANSELLYAAFSAWFDRVRENEYTPAITVDREGNQLGYSYQPFLQFGTLATAVEYPSFADLFDTYFGEKLRTEKLRQRASDIIRIVQRTETRLVKKLDLQRGELADSEKGEGYRKTGDLITANLYRIKRGMESFEAMDYEVDPPAFVTVFLDARLSPAQNAQKFYKLYTKSKTAHSMLKEQIARSEEELAYMDSVRTFLEKARTEADLAEIRDELIRAGYASKMKGYHPQKQVKPRPMTFVTSGGYRVLCGRNNLQNDLLTFRMADKGDLWFHAKGVPGSHVILVCGGEEPPESDYTEAAAIAAYYSKSNQDLVAVDYTRVKNVKKPPAAKPGFVTYKTNFTAFVRPMKGVEVK
jgi:predicted ribosome quality control (RQC) complex YloA/Tae2 family protein